MQAFLALVVAAGLQAGAPAPADGRDDDAARAAARATSERGIAGELVITTRGKPLRAKADQPITAPILARVIRSTVDADGIVTTRLGFIGTTAGVFDLAPLLEHADGTVASGLEPIQVAIESTLPETVGSDLFGGTESEPFRANRYRATLIAIGVLWLAVPIAVLVVRRMRRQAAAPVVPPAPPPSLADQLRPLVQSAIAGTLDVAGRGQLELLLYSYWRERRGLDGLSQAEAVSALRRDESAGELLVAVERWLHDRPDAANRSAERVEALLAPYRDAAAIHAPAPRAVAEAAR
jgi:hypothetical protein